VTGYETVIADAGVQDKRLLIVETEFSSTLKVADRKGNTLTGVVRQAWDTGALRLITKTNPAKSSDAHISIVGHIPEDELLRAMNCTELGNGFANRFLWACVKRSKLLPDGGAIQPEKLDTIVQSVRAALEFARNGRELVRDREARDIWYTIYEALSARKPGLLGAVLSRAEAQVTRLWLIYALLDRSSVIEPEHLNAALAVWEYCEASVAYVFGEAIGDPAADAILDCLRRSPEGLTRTEISALFGRNLDRYAIHSALDSLARRSLIERLREGTIGRPVERWFATRLKIAGAN
jgi:hypothetical protein